MGFPFNAIRRMRRCAAYLAAVCVFAGLFASAPKLPDPDAFGRSRPAPQLELAPTGPSAPAVSARPKHSQSPDHAAQSAILPVPPTLERPPLARPRGERGRAVLPMPHARAAQSRAPPAG